VKKLINPHNVIYAALLLVFASCSKLQGTVAPNVITPSHTTFASAYQPVTMGSYWDYKYTANGVSDTGRTAMTGLAINYDSKTFYEASTSFSSLKSPGAISYFSKDNHACYKLTVSNTDTLEQYSFNDTTALYGTWIGKVNQSGYIDGRAARYSGQIVEQGINFTVLGTVYNNVSHSKVYLQYSLGNNTYSTQTTYDLFIVKGIGVIASYTTDSLGNVTSKELIGYSIK
jgi:hypothetical protein